MGAKRRSSSSAETAQAFIEFKPDGTIIDTNSDFLQIFGYERPDIIGRSHDILVPEATRDDNEHHQFRQRLAEGQTQSGIYQRIAADGQNIWLRVSYCPVRNRRRRIQSVIGYATDVTELQRNKADLEGQIAAIDRSQAVISFKLDGTILDANDNFLATLGYRRDEIAGKHHCMFVAPEEGKSEAYQRFWTDLRQGQFKTALFRRIHKNGTPIWIQASYNPIFDSSGEPFKIVKYATNVTARTRTVAHLQSSLAALSDTVPAIAADARTAGQSSTDAVTQARDSDRVIEQWATRIDAINQQARDMAQIVDTLDSLAFQTNILALNASVEAARAGQNGRGFAVVAQEVRALANRSTESARDIAALIRGVTGALDECNQGAEQTRATIARMVDASEQVDQRIQQIAEAAETQAEGIAKLNSSLCDLEHDHA
ncbi:PAS domain-containing methyl-accepting chemotaxis protein [Salinisphaera sp. SPP-AMP-43]|uniref:methyl-accepting chemotaxis protein n=1 Tax=Salinisphaera sp. SPP-AMP-43 TaxID=3121288 RepID=UPI003C6E8100